VNVLSQRPTNGPDSLVLFALRNEEVIRVGRGAFLNAIFVVSTAKFGDNADLTRVRSTSVSSYWMVR